VLAFSPEIVIALAGVGVILFDALWPGRGRVERWITLGAMALAAGCAVYIAMTPDLYGMYFSGSLRVDVTTTFARLVFMAAGALIVLSSWATQGEGDTAEYYGLLLLSLLGESVIVTGQSLLVLFIGIELLALPCYALMAIRKHLPGAVRAALKYFLLGMFASIVMLYGVAILFGSLRTIGYANGLFPAAGVLDTTRTSVAMLGFLFLFVGLGFKVTAFPFHFWSPDVYATGSTPIVAYVATVPKVAVMLALWRILGPGFAAAYPIAGMFIAIVAVASMVYGNVVALLQDDVRRMLAYSGVANTGYMLIAFVAGGAASHHALAFFLAVYVFGNLGAFLVVMAMGVDSPVRMRDFSGLGARNGLIAAAMALCLFSLAGTPPLAGFFGKFALFMAAVDRGYAWLALVALITTVVSVGYYLKIATQMYGGIVTPAVAEAGDDEDDEDGGGALAPISTGRVNVAPALTAAILVCAAAAVVLGVFGVSLLTG
jgi:NADH-quinone oxidoreductase subunit N